MMMLTLTLMLCSGAIGADLQAVAPESMVVVTDGFELLSAEYEAAVEVWDDAYRAAEGMAARRELKSRHPAVTYWLDFEALVEAGEGRALLWMSRNVREKGLKTKAARAEKARLFGVLASDHVRAEWFGDVLDCLPRERRTLGEEELRIYRVVIEGNPHRAVKAHAMYQLAEVLLRSEDDGAQAEGEECMATLAEDYSDTAQGERAVDTMFERRFLSVGKVAPDFDATTIDGHEFKLSDYRGKVVLLDFYGFW